ncbi:MAG: hypothetical protein IJZ75_00485 [Clostridia bacterium]|nr:hypothetical protein [Clostridia bacterium]
MKEKNKKEIVKTPSVAPCTEAPENTFTLVNKYGTYEIQPTADTDNQYPAIAQGYNKKQQKFRGDKPEAEDNARQSPASEE